MTYPYLLIPAPSHPQLMMIDFGPIHRREIRLTDYAKQQNFDFADLLRCSNDMIDRLQTLLDDVEDTDVTFVPHDPDADDPYAETIEEMNAAWSLGHIIAHTTASSEECCAHAAELARGVEVCGRSRYETPWQQIQTVVAARQRLEESRRIRIAYLSAWPDVPNTDMTYSPYKSPQNCIVRVLAGLVHEESHLEQIKEAKHQARAAREEHILLIGSIEN